MPKRSLKREDFTRGGRTIYKNGEKFVYVEKEEGASPTDADCVAVLLCEVLNDINWDEVKRRYLKS